MLLFGEDGLYHDANPAACRLLRRSREDIVGRDVRDISGPSRADELDEAFGELVATRHVMMRRWALEDADGQEIEVKAVAVADIPAPGKYLGVVLSNGDGPRRRGRGRLSPREREVTTLLAR